MADTKVEILEDKLSKFTNNEGEEVVYHWYRARRGDGATFQFGSPKLYKAGDRIEANIEKYIRNDGKIGYKELA